SHRGVQRGSETRAMSLSDRRIHPLVRTARRRDRHIGVRAPAGGCPRQSIARTPPRTIFGFDTGAASSPSFIHSLGTDSHAVETGILETLRSLSSCTAPF